jgi:hypothetical protein
MAELIRFEGPSWQDGDSTPAVVVGGIQQHGDRFYGEVTLKGLYPTRAKAMPADWKLLAQERMLLRVKLTQRAGEVFTFAGTMNEEQTDLTFARRTGDIFDFVPGGTLAFAMPEDGV